MLTLETTENRFTDMKKDNFSVCKAENSPDRLLEFRNIVIDVLAVRNFRMIGS
jgi:hypothetical protein